MPEDSTLTPFQERFLAYLNEMYGLRPFGSRSSKYLWYLGFGLLFCLVSAIVSVSGGKFRLPFLPILLSGYAVTQIGAIHKERDALKRRVLNWVPVNTTLVQANQALFSKGTTDLPCLVVFSFDPAFGNNSAYMESLATRIFNTKGVEQEDPDLKAVSAMVTDERAVRYRRRRLPRSFTGGAEVYCADLWIRRAYLAEGYLMDRFVACLAEPGESGGLEMVPWEVVERFRTPKEPPR